MYFTFLYIYQILHIYFYLPFVIYIFRKCFRYEYTFYIFNIHANTYKYINILNFIIKFCNEKKKETKTMNAAI